jgi:hypothetical protein
MEHRFTSMEARARMALKSYFSLESSKDYEQKLLSTIWKCIYIEYMYILKHRLNYESLTWCRMINFLSMFILEYSLHAPLPYSISEHYEQKSVWI